MIIDDFLSQLFYKSL
jgi:hypothetical protein